MKSRKSGADVANLWQKLAVLAQDYRSRTLREAAERGAARVYVPGSDLGAQRRVTLAQS